MMQEHRGHFEDDHLKTLVMAGMGVIFYEVECAKKNDIAPTKCDSVLQNMTLLLENVTTLAKCDSVAKCGSCCRIDSLL